MIKHIDGLQGAEEQAVVGGLNKELAENLIEKYGKYRINIGSYVIVEANSPQEAIREVVARSENISHSESIEEDLLLNASIEKVEIEPEWEA